MPPSNAWLVFGSLETHVYVWNVVNPGQQKAIQIPTAGVATGRVNVVEWLGGITVLSAGADARPRIWELSLWSISAVSCVSDIEGIAGSFDIMYKPWQRS